MNIKYKIGDRVQYNHAFIRNMDCLDNEFDQLWGIVREIKRVGTKDYLKVEWDNSYNGATQMVNPSNMCKIGKDTTI